MVKNTGNQKIGKSGSQGALIGYIQVMKNIEGIFAERLDNVRKLCIETGKEMLSDFRSEQYYAERIKTKTKGQNEETANNNVAKAIEYARQHSNTVKTDRGRQWFNRTTRAARGVHAVIDATPEEISLGLSHGIYYGAYLEYAHNRKFAILEPLVRKYAPGLIQGVKNIMGGN